MSAVISCIRPFRDFFYHSDDQTLSERLHRIQRTVTSAVTQFGPVLSVGYSSIFKGRELVGGTLLAGTTIFLIGSKSKSEDKQYVQAMKIGVYTMGLGLTTMLHLTSLSQLAYEQRGVMHQTEVLEIGAKVCTASAVVINVSRVLRDHSESEKLKKTLAFVVPTVVSIGSSLALVSSFSIQSLQGDFEDSDQELKCKLVGVISSLAGIYLFRGYIIRPKLNHLLNWIG